MLSISEFSRARGVEQRWFEQNRWSTSRVILQKEKRIEDVHFTYMYVHVYVTCISQARVMYWIYMTEPEGSVTL